VVENRCLCCQKTIGNSFIVQIFFISLCSEEKEEEKEELEEELGKKKKRN
jgi:hypothetical protein